MSEIFIVVCSQLLDGVHVMSKDLLEEAHIPQFSSAPNQARKAASFYEANAAATELKVMVGTVRKQNNARRAAIAKYGKKALPSE